jgi:hypothetical protein
MPTNTETPYTGCPPGYVLVGDACINPVTGSIYELAESSAYEFEYYQNSGELIGRFKPFAIGDPSVAPIYFGQNAKVQKIKHFNIPELRQNISPDDSVLYFDVEHKDNSGSPTAIIIENFISGKEGFRNSFSFGEFYGLSNSLRSIKRMNLNFDLVQGNRIFGNWLHSTGLDSSLPSAEEGSLNSFVKWYFGYSKIPNNQRPLNMRQDEEALIPTIQSPVTATEKLQWETVESTCYNWIRVYDKSNIQELLQSVNLKYGQYICQVKVEIDEAKLQDFILRNVDSSLYVEGQIDFNLILYPPSFYMYPADSITRIESPAQNSVNDFFREMTFRASDNYKTDGNIHYTIEFLTARNSEDILFETSTFSESSSFEEFHWFSSSNKEEWTPITASRPTFDNAYEASNGADSEGATYIKYELSDAAKLILQDRSDILFKITQLDGTLIK